MTYLHRVGLAVIGVLRTLTVGLAPMEVELGEDVLARERAVDSNLDWILQHVTNLHHR